MSRTAYMNARRKANKTYRNARRKANYASSRVLTKPIKRRISGVAHIPWSQVEEQLIMDPTYAFTDRQLGKKLGRSVQAIQQKRYHLNQERLAHGE